MLEDVADTHESKPVTRLEKRCPLVVIVGIDGSGKSTQARLLAQDLRSRGIAPALCPSKPHFAMRLLSAIAGNREVTSVVDLETIRLLFAFERVHDLYQFMSTNSDARFVIIDRYAYCHYAFGRALGATNEAIVREAFSFLPTPDVVVFLSIDPEEALSRLRARHDYGESFELLRAFHEGYVSLPEYPRFLCLDAGQRANALHAQIVDAIVSRCDLR